MVDRIKLYRSSKLYGKLDDAIKMYESGKSLNFIARIETLLLCTVALCDISERLPVEQLLNIMHCTVSIS